MDVSLPRIPSLAEHLAPDLRARIDHKTKPLGALGRLESLAVQIGLIQDTVSPALGSGTVVVFAGDHGLAAEGISPYPSAVTAQMVVNFLRGGAAVNVLARQHGLDVKVVDAGVAANLPDHINLIPRKVCFGTANSAQGPAMTRSEVERCLSLGIEIATTLSDSGVKAILPGEMGIGNSSAAALVFSTLQGIPLVDCVGRGAGHDDAGLARKLSILTLVQERHPEAARGPLAAAQCFGGSEMVMMAGAMLGAASRRMVVVIDGFIASAAALLAAKLRPEAQNYFIYAHLSAESGHVHALRAAQVRPLLDLGLRLGEGTGAVLAWPLLVSAVKILNEMATFESAGVSTSTSPARGSVA